MIERKSLEERRGKYPSGEILEFLKELHEKCLYQRQLLTSNEREIVELQICVPTNFCLLDLNLGNGHWLLASDR